MKRFVIYPSYLNSLSSRAIFREYEKEGITREETVLIDEEQHIEKDIVTTLISLQYQNSKERYKEEAKKYIQ